MAIGSRWTRTVSLKYFSPGGRQGTLAQGPPNDGPELERNPGARLGDGPDIMETWLKPNRRALLAGAVVPGIILALGVAVALRPWPGESPWIGRVTGGILILMSTTVLIGLSMHIVRPRIGHRRGQLYFLLRSRQAIAVPVDVVEGFFLATVPTGLPSAVSRGPNSIAVVARLAEKANTWAQRDVHPWLARWQEGYITIRGTWCEPLNTDVIRRLNQRLMEAKHQR